jgi:hypothetical protein
MLLWRSWIAHGRKSAAARRTIDSTLDQTSARPLSRCLDLDAARSLARSLTLSTTHAAFCLLPTLHYGLPMSACRNTHFRARSLTIP